MLNINTIDIKKIVDIDDKHTLHEYTCIHGNVFIILDMKIHIQFTEIGSSTATRHYLHYT